MDVFFCDQCVYPYLQPFASPLSCRPSRFLFRDFASCFRVYCEIISNGPVCETTFHGQSFSLSCRNEMFLGDRQLPLQLAEVQ